MTKKIIDPTVEAKKNAAVSIGHQLFLIDQVLKTSSDGYQVRITLGWEAPQGTLMPVGTMVMPLPFASELAEALTNCVTEGERKRNK